VVWGNVQFVQPSSASDIVDAVNKSLPQRVPLPLSRDANNSPFSGEMKNTEIPKKIFDWEKTVEEIEKLYN
jgi:hypothetical protein